MGRKLLGRAKYTATMPATLLAQLDIDCATQGITRSAMLEQLARAHLRRRPPTSDNVPRGTAAPIDTPPHPSTREGRIEQGGRT